MGTDVLVPDGRAARAPLAALAAAGLMFAVVRPVHCQTFVNVTAPAGINHVHTRPYTPGYHPTSIQEQAGGAAAGDFDGDGWADLYVTRFWDADILYRNNRDGTFTDVTATVFGPNFGVHQTNGTVWGDVDNDGDLDLAVSTMYEGRHLLYVNDGAGHFSEDGAARGFTMLGGHPDTSGSGVAMGDYDRDGYLDMYVAEWRSFGVVANPAQSRLFRNLGSAGPGQFVDVTAVAGVAMDQLTGNFANKSLAFTPRFSDLDRDGHTDIVVSSDGGTTRLFWNNGDNTFTDGTAAAGDFGIPAFPPDADVGAGTNDMGFTLADFNGDELLDMFITSIGNGSGVHYSGNRMFLNNGNRTFTDATYATGVREGGWGWGADAIDYDNDGDLDIAHTNGFALAAIDQTIFFKNIGSRTNPQYINLNSAVGITDTGQGRGLLTFDVDRDGDLDLFIVNHASAPILYRNDIGAAAGDWLQVRTVGTESNRDGIGAYVTVTPNLATPDIAYVTEIDGSTNYLGQSELVAHFGLGNVAHIEQINVLWPSGYAQRFTNVAPNQRITVTEGLLADFNGDDIVDAADLTAWRLHAGLAGGASPANGDADRDGDVDGADFFIWQRSVGRSVDSGISEVGASEVIPEPGTVMLAAVGLAFQTGLARRRVRSALLA